MRVLVSLAVAAAALAAEPTPRGDQVTLTDGRRLPGALALQENGRLRFKADDGSALVPELVQDIRFNPASPLPFRAGVVHRVFLTGDQHLSGELLALDDRALRLRTPWHERLAVPRGGLVGVTSLPGKLILRDED